MLILLNLSGYLHISYPLSYRCITQILEMSKNSPGIPTFVHIFSLTNGYFLEFLYISVLLIQSFGDLLEFLVISFFILLQNGFIIQLNNFCHFCQSLRPDYSLNMPCVNPTLNPNAPSFGNPNAPQFWKSAGNQSLQSRSYSK